jgi:hypothetical protein
VPVGEGVKDLRKVLYSRLAAHNAKPRTVVRKVWGQQLFKEDQVLLIQPLLDVTADDGLVFF